MRRFSLILLMCILVSHISTAQNRGTIQIGAGGTVLGEWDQRGVLSFVQYQHKLNDHFSVTPRISFLMAGGVFYIGEETPGEELYAQSSGMSLDADLNYAPVKRFKDNFYISVGPSVRYLQQTYPKTVSKRRFPDGTTTFEVDQTYYSGYSVGGTVALNLAATISKDWLLGAKVSLQGYTSGSMIPFYGLFLGYRL